MPDDSFHGCGNNFPYFVSLTLSCLSPLARPADNSFVCSGVEGLGLCHGNYDLIEAFFVCSCSHG